MTNRQIEALSAQFGTPLYVFDERVLQARARFLRRQFPAGTSLCFAVKANPFAPHMLRGLVERFEVCSPGESAICQRAGIPYAKQVISGVYKTADALEPLIGTGAHFTAESPRQYALICRLAERRGTPVRLLLRLTSGNQFGMDAATIRQLIARRDAHPLVSICGLQYFSGTQKTSVKRFARELGALDGLALELQRDFGFSVREIEYGPGFPVDYFSADGLEAEQVLFSACSKAVQRLQCGASVTLEIGRSLAASCGTYLTRVVDVKRSAGQNYAILDGGIHHLTYYGQGLALRQPLLDRYPSRTGATELWNLCGALCTVNDILVKQLPVSSLQCGDIFAFQQAGAYCMTEGPSLLLSRALPRVAFVQADGTPILAREALPTDRLNSPTIKGDTYGTTTCYFTNSTPRHRLYQLP